jgi:hypothetical protein
MQIPYWNYIVAAFPSGHRWRIQYAQAEMAMAHN